MSDFEMLSIVLMILGIVVTILIAYIDHLYWTTSKEGTYHSLDFITRLFFLLPA